MDVPSLAFWVSVGLALIGLVSSNPRMWWTYFEPNFNLWKKQHLRTVLGCYVFSIAVNSIHSAIAHLFGYGEIWRQPSSFEILDFRYVCLLPIFEEVCDRGLSWEGFRRLGRLREGVMVSSILFGLGHSPHWLGGIVVALLLSYLRLETGSLVFGMALHVLMNLFSRGVNDVFRDLDSVDLMAFFVRLAIGLVLAIISFRSFKRVMIRILSA